MRLIVADVARQQQQQRRVVASTVNEGRNPMEDPLLLARHVTSIPADSGSGTRDTSNKNSSRDEAAKDAGVSPKENGGNAGCGGGGGAGGGDSPTHSAGTPPASHPSRDLLQEILRKPGPYPMVVLPSSGGYWCDDGSDTAASGRHGAVDAGAASQCKLELDETARCYRRFFLAKVSCQFPPPPPPSNRTRGTGLPDFWNQLRFD